MQDVQVHACMDILLYYITLNVVILYYNLEVIASYTRCMIMT